MVYFSHAHTTGTNREMAVNKFAYRLKNTGSSSQRLGKCEVCDQHATEVFHQVESRSVEKSPGFDRYTYADCSNLFGHRDCLISRQRTESQAA